MAKNKPTKAKPATKSSRKPVVAKAKHGPPVEEGIEVTRELNETAREAVESGSASATAAAPVTWPTEYGNPDMSIAPATPVVIEDGVAVPAGPSDITAAVGEGEGDEHDAPPAE